MLVWRVKLLVTLLQIVTGQKLSWNFFGIYLRLTRVERPSRKRACGQHWATGRENLRIDSERAAEIEPMEMGDVNE